MLKLFALLTFSSALGSAERLITQQRFGRTQHFGSRMPARQKLASIMTPYPAAQALKPQHAFYLPGHHYGAPQQIYGSPATAPETTSVMPEEFAPHPDAEEFLPLKETRARLSHRRSRLQQQRLRLFQRLQDETAVAAEAALSTPLLPAEVDTVPEQPASVIQTLSIGPTIPVVAGMSQPAFFTNPVAPVPVPLPVATSFAGSLFSAAASPFVYQQQQLHSYELLNQPFSYTEQFQTW